MMDGSPLKFWPLIQSTIREFWEIVEPVIEEAAIRYEVPVELYYYSELGLDSFSRRAFQKRDPFSNPQVFEKLFVTLNVKGWIQPQADGSYQVTEKARQAARRIIQSGDDRLLPLDSSTTVDLQRLAVLLKKLVLANAMAPPPPEKWAVSKRFHASDDNSPLIVQVREYLMDLFAYRDDCHLSASYPHFGQAGIIWSVLGALWNLETVTAEKIAESHTFRGYDVHDYEIALQAAVQLGWAQEARGTGEYSISPTGQALREEAERLTNEYFYNPWSAMTPDELDELYSLLSKLREELISFRRRK
jgi:hypothetical protein